MTRRYAMLAILAACTVPAGVAEARQPRGGGLVPAPAKTREELVREWDLNSDGKIDKGEMEVASSRMRRERAALRLNSGIDPVTGLPRGEEPIEIEPDDADMAAETEPSEEEPADDDRDTGTRLPGTRVPKPARPGAGRDRAGGASKAAAAATGPAGTRAAADQKRQAVMGGVRGGGMPARSGYGSGLPAAPLNAGLPITPPGRPGTAAPAPARGGLVPGPRPAAPPPRPSGSRDLYDPY